MVGANIANLKRGGDYTSERSANLQIAQTSVAQAAEAVNVGNNNTKGSTYSE